MESIIAAVVSGVFAVIVCLIAQRAQMAQTIAVIETKLTNLENMIDRLETKQDKHNGVIDRVYHLEQNDAVQSERISALSDAVEDLKP